MLVLDFGTIDFDRINFKPLKVIEMCVQINLSHKFYLETWATAWEIDYCCKPNGPIDVDGW